MNEDIQTLKRGMFWKTISTVITAGSGFLMSVIFARFLGKDIYGELILVYITASLFVMLSNFGLNAAFQRFIPLYIKRDEEKKFNDFLSTAVSMGVFFTCFFSVTMLLMVNFISINIFHRPSLIPYMKLGVLYLFSYSLLTNMILSIYYGLERWKEECLFIGTYLFFYFLAVFIALSIFGKSISRILIINATLSLIWVIVGMFYIIRFVKPLRITMKFREFVAQIKEILRFSAPMLIVGIIFYLIVQFDKVILGVYRSTEELAQYYIGCAIGTKILIFLRTSENVFTPYLAKFSGEANAIIKNKFQTIFRLFLHLPIGLSIFLYFLVDFLIRLVYGPGFEISAAVLKIYLMVIILRCSLIPVGLFLVNVYGKTFDVTKMGVVNGIAHVIFYLALIPKYGYKGALAATIIVNILMWFYVALFVKDIHRLIPYKSLLFAGIGAGIVISINFIIRYYQFYNGLVFSAVLPLIYLFFILMKGDIDYRKIKDIIFLK